MKGTYKNTIDFDFGGVSFQNQILTERVKVENKIVKKLNKHNFKRSHKIESDIETIKDLITELDNFESINLISKKFDSPNIIIALLERIKNIYIATWAITPAGINALVEIVNSGTVNEAYLLLDKTHSYKWIFQSTAYEILKGKVKIRFCANHSKFICIEHENGYLNFSGSMNFSNNPRFENINIDKDKETFDFYKTFVKTVSAETL
jgi:hypothetical protein